MPRAHRYFIPGHVWHITHRCHQQEFLLKFARDRRQWRHWLFEARKRFGLSILNYTITSNHIHLLVRDTGKDVIPKSLQLIAGRTAQEYNQRKGRKGAFWEDRYHATAVDTDAHLAKCLVYIDLNMVRAGVVSHPCDWFDGGYREIQQPTTRYRVIDQQSLLALFGFSNGPDFQQIHRQWVEAELKADTTQRQPFWTESLAVGRKEFVQDVQAQLGASAMVRAVIDEAEHFMLKEPPASYTGHLGQKNTPLSLENSYIWNDKVSLS